MTDGSTPPRSPIAAVRELWTGALAWGLIVIVIILSVDIVSRGFGGFVYVSDGAMAEEAFWRGRSMFRATLASPVIPRQLPGPLDSWAGGDVKSINIESPCAGGMELSISLYDSHESAPPLLSVTAGGREIGSVRAEKGAGAASRYWINSGKPSSYTLNIPAGAIKGKGDVITLRGVEGSWMAIERVTLRPLVSTPKLFTALTAALALLALALWRWGARGLTDVLTAGSYAGAAVLAALAAAAAWVANTRDLGLYIAWNGYTPITYVRKIFQPDLFGMDFSGGTALFDVSLFMRVYKLGWAAFGIEPERMLPYVIGFQLFFMAAAVVALARTAAKDAPPPAILLAALMAFASYALDTSFGGYGKPPPIQSLMLYYNVSDGLILFAIALILRSRPVLSFTALALAFCVYPTTAVMGVVFLLAALLMVPGGLTDRRVMAGAAIFAAIAVLWTATQMNLGAVTGGGVSAADYFRLTAFSSFHLYPVEMGMFTAKHHTRFIPFLSFMLLFVYYMGRKPSLDRLDRKIIVGVAALLVTSAIGVLISYFKPSVTLVKLSLHRANELAAVVALAPVAAGLWRDFTEGEPWKRILAAAVMISPFVPGGPPFPLLYCAALVAPDTLAGLGRTRRSAGAGMTFLWLMLIIVAICYYASSGVYAQTGGPFSLDGYTGGPALLYITLGALVIVAITDAYMSRWRGALARLFPAVIVALALGWLCARAQPPDDRWRREAASYRDVQLWAANSTPRDALFMTDPSMFLGWRDFSLRSSFGVAHEWALAGWVYSSDATVFREGMRRMMEFSVDGDLEEMIRPASFHGVAGRVTKRYYTFDDEWRRGVAERYGVDYFVMFRRKVYEWSRHLSLPVAYENRDFIVYRAR